MSRDLILRSTPKNWARGDASCAPSPVALPPTPRIVLTPEEKTRVGKLAALRSKAASGDAKARKEWRFAQAKIAMLRDRARGGDPKATRSCQVLEQGGLFGKPVKPSVSGREEISGELVGRMEISGEESLGEFVGDEERLARESGPAERAAAARISGASPRRHRGKQRSRNLRKLVWRASRGDAAAAAKLQQVTARLQQRASAGDARASAVLQKVQSMQVRAQAQAAQQPAAPPPPPAYAPPQPTPTQPIEATYAAPAADFEEDYE
jgi:hypothetical protein